MPAFFGYAGVNLQQGNVHIAEHPKKGAETEIPIDILIKTEAECIGLTDNLRDCTVYQKIWNGDISEWEALNFDDQGIIFGLKSEVFDKMKQMYQSTLRTASVPGVPGDNRDDDKGNSKHLSHRRPGGNDPWPPQTRNRGDRNYCPSNNGGSGGGRQPSRIVAGPPVPPDGGDDGDNESDRLSSHSHNWGDDGNRHPDRRYNHRGIPPYRGYSVPAAVHPRFNTPGVMEVVEHHHNYMHDRLLWLVCEHVSVRLNLPDGTKV